jgi:hypothetical protein
LGAIWTRHKAAVFKTPYNFRHGGQLQPATCPLPGCQQDDTTAHILGSCKNPDITALRIKRHNVAVQHIQTFVATHCWGDRLTIMDATSSAELPDGITSTQVPGWLLPPHDSNAANLRQRPDIMIVCGLPHDTPTITALPADKTILLVEFGFCDDTQVDKKYEAKQGQHTQLMSRLQAAGWQPRLYTIMLGTKGTNFKTAAATLKDITQAPTDSITRLLNKLNVHAVEYMHHIICQRRTLEWGGPQPTQPTGTSQASSDPLVAAHPRKRVIAPGPADPGPAKARKHRDTG